MRTLGRIVALAVAAVLAVVGANLMSVSRGGNAALKRATDARPLNMDVDLSKPGSFRAECEHDRPPQHGSEVVCLQVSQAAEPAKLLADLQAKCTVTDAHGTILTEQDFSTDLLGRQTGEPGTIMLFQLPLRDGRQTVALAVTQGAPALAGVSQRLTSRYSFCPCEFSGGAIARVVGITTLAAAAIILVCVVISWKWARNT